MLSLPSSAENEAKTTVKMTPAPKLQTVTLCLALALAWPGSAPADTKSQAQLSKEIKQLSNQLNDQKKASSSLNDEVTRVEKKLGDIARQQHDTEKKIEDTLNRLQEANSKKQVLDGDLKIQRSALAQQLQAMYTAGEQSHLRLLLRQDNPSDISRTLRYLEYLNTHRTRKIQSINDTLGKIDTLTRSMEKDRQDLRGLEETLGLRKREAQLSLREREAALDKLNGDIRNKQGRLDKLRKDEANLQAVLDKLAAKAAAEHQEKQRKLLAARKKAEQAQQQAAAPRTSAPVRPAAPVAQARPAPQRASPASQTASFVPNKPFSVLKGRLPFPVSGKVLHTYGASRNEKQQWRGMVIAAAGGSRVQAVAPGKVVFSGWMDGYGHLIIVEHDQNYISLYGYNRAVYKKEGQLVKAGEAIAAVGNSSGQRENALYFEIRRKGIPQNPAQWLR